MHKINSADRNRRGDRNKPWKLGVSLVLGGALVAAGCSAGGSDSESPLPGTNTQGATLTTPVVVSPPNPSDARPSSTTEQPAESGGSSTSSSSSSGEARTASTTYVVKRGDTLESIANQFPGISANDIARTNSLDDPNKIFAEQELIIPAP